jgi:hypothetical protein
MPEEAAKVSAAETTEALENFVGRLEQHLKQVRRGGNPAEIVAAAKAADGAIQARMGSLAGGVPEDRRAALTAARRLLFNAAADCWPGWAIDSPRGHEADLLGALDLARRSRHLVEQLVLGATQQGTAIWLEGAFELALGRIDDALMSFGHAERCYREVPAPAQVLLMQGYVAITLEAGARRPPDDTKALDRILETLAAGQFEDGKAFRDQLLVARRIFA